MAHEDSVAMALPELRAEYVAPQLVVIEASGAQAKAATSFYEVTSLGYSIGAS